MDRVYFKEEDKEKVIKFLNLVALKAKFTMDTKEIIEYFNLLSYMQKDLLPKMDSNIMEITKVTEPEQDKKDD